MIVNDAILALTEMANANPALEDVQVFDGPPTEYAHNELLAFGLEVTQDFGLEGTQQKAGLSAKSRLEAHIIGCLIDVVTGNDDLPGMRVRAYQIFDAVDQMIKNDNRLNKTVTSAEITNTTFLPLRTTEGIQTTILFTVRITKL